MPYNYVISMKNKKMHDVPEHNLTDSYEETVKAAGDMYTKYVHRIADKERSTDIKYEAETDAHKRFENISDDESSERKL
jgi:hypothetical protein